METRSRARKGQPQISTGAVLEGPAARWSTDVEEDLQIGTLMDDRAVTAVGGGRPEVGAATRQPGDDPVTSEVQPSEAPSRPGWVAVREPVTKSPRPPQPIAIPTQVTYLPRPPMLRYPHQNCHVGWGPGRSQSCQVSLKSVQGFGFAAQ